jgi:hypothetical protein
LANTGMAHFRRRSRKMMLPLSLLALLPLFGALRAQEGVLPPPESTESAGSTTASPTASGQASTAADTPPSSDPPSTPDGAPSTAAGTPATPGGQPPAPGSPPTTPGGSPPIPVTTPPDEPVNQSDQNVPYHWLDRTREALYGTMWHSAEHVDRWFGSDAEDAVYQQAHGSIAPALLYTQYDGLRTQVRFNLNFPLPQINDRIHAFVGRFDPNEFITERDEPSGSIPRTYGPPTEDQTLLGIGYHQPDKQGSRFDAGAGIRLSFPMDPYVKGAYVFERGKSASGLFSVRETLFWQHSEGAGETTRLDLERVFDQQLLVRYTLSGTRSQRSEGLRGYSSILLVHGMSNRRSAAFEVGVDGQTQAEVPLHDYGFKVAYRQAILRRWLIMEVRSSVDWPKDFHWQRRKTSLGVGFGFEMLLGTDEFLARPVTF